MLITAGYNWESLYPWTSTPHPAPRWETEIEAEDEGKQVMFAQRNLRKRLQPKANLKTKHLGVR